MGKKIYGLCVVFIGWWVLHLMVASPAIPHPIPTLKYTIQHSFNFMPHLSASMLRIFVAMGLAGGLGVGLGIIMGRSKVIDSWLAPVVYILYPIPKIAFLPVFMLLFGLGETPKILLILSVIIFQFMMSTKDAILDIEPAYLDSVTSLGLSPKEVLRHCIVPAILPHLFTSLRVAVGVSVAILFFAENFSTKFGLGYYIMNSYAMANYQSMYAGIIILSVVGLVVYTLIDILEKRLCPWLFE